MFQINSRISRVQFENFPNQSEDIPNITNDFPKPIDNPKSEAKANSSTKEIWRYQGNWEVAKKTLMVTRQNSGNK